MPAIASLEELRTLNQEIKKLKEEYPEACAKIKTLIRVNRSIGYKNFCKLFTEEATPEILKTGRTYQREIEV